MVRVAAADVPSAVVTVTVAVDPGTTCHWPPVPEGDGIVNVISLSLQLPRLNVARSGGAPQLVPASLKVM
jgi:hypothetical protein